MIFSLLMHDDTHTTSSESSSLHCDSYRIHEISWGWRKPSNLPDGFTPFAQLCFLPSWCTLNGVKTQVYVSWATYHIHEHHNISFRHQIPECDSKTKKPSSWLPDRVEEQRWSRESCRTCRTYRYNGWKVDRYGLCINVLNLKSLTIEFCSLIRRNQFRSTWLNSSQTHSTFWSSMIHWY